MNNKQETGGKPETRWIAIARTGEFADSSGRKHRFTPELLDEIAANYAASEEEAPLVFGHPKDNEPAQGWVKALKSEGGKLFAEIAQISADAKEKVQNGLYRYVSMSLHPCGKKLRHVGLLGAVPPAISGLGAVEFAEDGRLTINFSAAELAPALKPEGEPMENMLKELQTKNAELEARAGALQKALDEALAGRAAAEKQAEATAAEFSAYKGEVKAGERRARLEALTKEGKVTPAEHERINAMLDALERAGDDRTVNFASPAGVEKISPVEAYWRELEGRESSPLASDFSALAPKAAEPVQSIDLSHKI